MKEYESLESLQVIHQIDRSIIVFQLWYFEIDGQWLLHDPITEGWVNVEATLIILIHSLMLQCFNLPIYLLELTVHVGFTGHIDLCMVE